MKPKYFNITLYERSQHYGGPEEGGWYYNWYEPMKTQRLKGKNTNYGFYPIKRDFEKYQEIASQTGNHGKYYYEGGVTFFVEKCYGINASTKHTHYE